MGGYKIRNQNSMHYLTFTVVGWVDVFTRKMYRDIFIDSLKFCQKEKGLLLYSYVIMSNHVHLIIRTESESGLSVIVRDLKRYTSNHIIKAILENRKESRAKWMLRVFKEYGEANSNNKNYQFWIQNNRPMELISAKFIFQKMNYIHLNPVKAGIVEKPEHYLYSSARDYVGMKGMIDVELLY